MTLMLQTVTKQIMFPCQRANDDRGLWERSPKHQKVGSSFRISSTGGRRTPTTAILYRTVRLERKRSSDRSEKSKNEKRYCRHLSRRAVQRQVAWKQGWDSNSCMCVTTRIVRGRLRCLMVGGELHVRVLFCGKPEVLPCLGSSFHRIRSATAF